MDFRCNSKRMSMTLFMAVLILQAPTILEAVSLKRRFLCVLACALAEDKASCYHKCIADSMATIKCRLLCSLACAVTKDKPRCYDECIPIYCKEKSPPTVLNDCDLSPAASPPFSDAKGVRVNLESGSGGCKKAPSPS